MQNVSTMIRRPVPVGAAAAGSLLALVAGAVIALATPVVVGGVTTGHSSSPTVFAQSIGGEQIAHNRSEADLGGSTSVGAEQISHNRSEEGLTRP